jgi:ferritin
MLSKKMEAALNEQVNKEIYSAYLYLSMSAYSIHIGLKGFANWFTVQSQEELAHAMKLYTHINDQNGKVRLMAIDAPPSEWESPLEMFEKTLKHEQSVTKRIKNLVKLATKEKDQATNVALQWFVTEQIEEEANDNDIIAKLKQVGDKVDALLMLDRELETRVFEPPPTTSEAA